MRNIKFRAWDTENNCFFKPIYEAYKGNLEEIVLSMSGDINIRTMSPILNHESNFPNRFILSQFTGLKDKNGKEIYEGDIVDVNATLGHGRERKIYFRNGGFGFEAIPNVSQELCYLEVWTKDVAVVGNMYENAGLLKG